MADEDDIIQRISLLGVDEARKELESFGDDGAAALDKITKAGNGDFAKGLKALSPELAKVQDGLDATGASAAKLPGIFNKVAAAITQLTGLSFGKTIAKDADAASASSINLSKSVRGVGKDIRALGRVTDVAGLSGFGRSIALVSRNLATLALPAAVGALGAFADSAANATQKFQDLAFTVAKSPQDLQSSASAAIAFGGDVEKLSESLAKIPAAASAAAASERALAAASANIRTTIDKNTDAIDKQLVSLKNAKEGATKAAFAYNQFQLTVALGLDPVSGLNDQISDLNDAYRKGTISQADYTKQSDKLSKQLILAQRQQSQESANLRDAQAKANQAVVDSTKAYNDQIDAADASEKAARAQKAEVEANATAFTKLGIASSQLKSLKIEDSFKLVGDRLANMDKGATRNALAFEIFGDNARKLLAALDSGAGGIDKFIAEGQRVAPAFTEAQNAIGDKFLLSIDKLEAALGSLKNQFGITVAPAFITFFDKITDIVVAIRPGFVAFAETLSKSLAPALKLVGDGIEFFTQQFDSKKVGEFTSILVTVLVPILKGIGTAISIAIKGFQLFIGALGQVAALINKAFGTNLDGVQLFATIIAGLVIVFGGWIPAIGAAVVAISSLVTEIGKLDFSGIKNAASSVWKFLTDGFQAVSDFITGTFQAASDAVTTAWTTVVDFFTGIWTGITDGVTAVTSFISNIFNGAAIAVSNAFNTAIQFVTGLWEQFKSYLASWVSSFQSFFAPVLDTINKIAAFFSSSGSTGDAAGAAGFADGGKVQGPGTGTSDSVMARLSNGEFVVKAKAVAHYGTQFMHTINNMRAPRFPAFNMGGLVDALSPVRSIPRFAEGGSVTGATQRSHFTLQLGDTAFEGLSAPTDTADKMVKFATVRAMRATGRRPNWYGAGK